LGERVEMAFGRAADIGRQRDHMRDEELIGGSWLRVDELEARGAQGETFVVSLEHMGDGPGGMSLVGRTESGGESFARPTSLSHGTCERLESMIVANSASHQRISISAIRRKPDDIRSR
jgi:hypothetical protein